MTRMTRGFLESVLVCVLLCAASAEVATQSREDPVLGTWQLLVDAAGASNTISYVSDYDSVEYPIVGSAAANTISWLPIDPNTAEASVSHASRVIATTRYAVRVGRCPERRRSRTLENPDRTDEIFVDICVLRRLILSEPE